MKLATKFSITITAALLITLPAWAAQKIDGSKIVLTRAASFAPVAALHTRVKAVRAFSNNSIEQREKNDKHLNDFAAIFYALDRKHPYSRATKDKDDNKIFIGGRTDANLQNLICTYLEDEFQCCDTFDITRGGYADSVSALCAPASGFIASGGYDGSMTLFRIDTTTNPPKLQLFHTLDRTRGDYNIDTVYALCAPAPGLIASGSYDGTMTLWRIDTTTNPPTFQHCDTLDRVRRGHTNVVSGFCVPASGMIVSGSWDGTMKLWRIDTTTNPPKLQLCDRLDLTRGGGISGVSALCACAPGLIASGADDGTLKLWRVDINTSPTKLQLCNIFSKSNSRIRALCVPTSGLITSGASDGTMKLWASTAWLLRNCTKKR